MSQQPNTHETLRSYGGGQRYPVIPGEQYPSHPVPGQAYPPPGKGYPQPKSHETLRSYGGGQRYTVIPGQQYPSHPLPGQAYPPPGQGYPQPQYGGGQLYQLYPAIPGQQYLPQNGAPVNAQPTAYVKPPPLADPVDTHMGYSIFTMLCCFQPLGIAAFIFSIFARNANQSGDQLMAERSSRTSRALNNVALGIGLTILFLVIIYIYNFDD